MIQLMSTSALTLIEMSKQIR